MTKLSKLLGKKEIERQVSKPFVVTPVLLKRVLAYLSVTEVIFKITPLAKAFRGKGEFR